VLPPPIRVGNTSYSIAECVAFVVDNDERYSRPTSKIRAGMRCVKAFENPKPCDAGSYAELEDQDHEFLRTVFENPSEACGFGKFSSLEIDGRVVDVRLPPRTFMPFPDAISEAKHERPVLTPKQEPMPTEAAAPPFCENEVS